MMNKPLLFITIFISGYALPCLAKEPKSWVDTFLETLGSSEEINVEDGIDWAVLPGPFANPEQGVGLGVAAVGLYAAEDNIGASPLSTVTVTGYGSTSGSYGIGINNRTYLLNDELRVLVQAKASHTPEYYWGIGKDQAETTSNKTVVEAEILSFTPQLAYQFLPSTYFVMGWNVESYRNQTSDSLLLSASDLLNHRLSAVTLSLEYDSRDFELNAKEGMLLSLNWNGYREAFGSDYDVDKLTLNYRQYYVMSESTILAWEGFAEVVKGDIPWFAYSTLGSDKRMRGYYSGQYRDKTQLSTQVEIRHQFTQRHGAVAWVGAGNVVPETSELFRSSWLPTYGVGYRFSFKPRVNVRLDYGVGKNNHAVYFQVNEAF